MIYDVINKIFSAAGNKRPVSRYAMVKAAETENPRYKCENVLQLELGNFSLYSKTFHQFIDMPAPTTKEWDGFNTENKIMSIDQVPDQKSPFESEIVIQASVHEIFWHL